MGIKKAKIWEGVGRRNEYSAYLALCGVTVWPWLLLSIWDQSRGKAGEKNPRGRDYTLLSKFSSFQRSWGRFCLILTVIIIINAHTCTLLYYYHQGGLWSYFTTQLSSHCSGICEPFSAFQGHLPTQTHCHRFCNLCEEVCSCSNNKSFMWNNKPLAEHSRFQAQRPLKSTLHKAKKHWTKQSKQ